MRAREDRQGERACGNKERATASVRKFTYGIEAWDSSSGREMSSHMHEAGGRRWGADGGDMSIISLQTCAEKTRAQQAGQAQRMGEISLAVTGRRRKAGMGQRQQIQQVSSLLPRVCAARPAVAKPTTVLSPSHPYAPFP